MLNLIKLYSIGTATLANAKKSDATLVGIRCQVSFPRLRHEVWPQYLTLKVLYHTRFFSFVVELWFGSPELLKDSVLDANWCVDYKPINPPLQARLFCLQSVLHINIESRSVNPRHMERHHRLFISVIVCLIKFTCTPDSQFHLIILFGTTRVASLPHTWQDQQ